MSFGLNEGPDYQDLQTDDEHYAQDTNSPGGYGSQETPAVDGDREVVDPSLRPLNIAQIHMAKQKHFTGNEHTLDGFPITLITVIAQVRSVEVQMGANMYKLDDGSGEIYARHSKDVGATQGTLGYVQVTGTIISLFDNRYIDASTVHILEDPMEAFFHLNRVIAATMIYKRELSDGSTSPRKPPATSSSGISSGGATTVLPDKYSHLDPVEGAIVWFFETNPPGIYGHHVRQILDGTKRIAPESLAGEKAQQLQLIETAIDTLTEQGILFSTLDEQHYALC